MRKNKELYELLLPTVTALDIELVDIEYHPNPKNTIVRILIDKTDGINLDDCIKVNQQVTGVLDVEDPISGAYTLEVSSPGIDRPLFFSTDFQRFMGKEVKVRLSIPIDRKRNIKGKISCVEGDNITITNAEEIDCLFNINNLESARLSPDFDKF